MDHLDRFRGDYDEKVIDLAQRRDELIARARTLVPANFMDLLATAAANEDDEATHDLTWVRVPDPRPGSTAELEVLPALGLSYGETEEEGASPAIPAGMSSLMLVGRLPNGQEAPIGLINTYGTHDEPMLFLNLRGDDTFCSEFIAWNHADAEIFLSVAQSALDAQPPTA